MKKINSNKQCIRKQMMALMISVCFFFLTFCSCLRDPLSEKQIIWWKAWNDLDTAIFFNSESWTVDTLVMTEKEFYQPKTVNPFNPIGYDINLGDDGKCKAFGRLKHNGNNFLFSFMLDGGNLKTGGYMHVNNMQTEFFNNIDSVTIRIKTDGYAYFDYEFEYVIIHQDSALVEYSLDSVVYRRIK